MLLKSNIWSVAMIILGLGSGTSIAQTRNWKVNIVEKIDTTQYNNNYVSNATPLLKQAFIKLPVGSVLPKGWLLKMIDLQKDGLTGHLDEISVWLGKEDNAWLNSEGKGTYGWEELPYWLKGYGDIAYTTQDSSMLKHTLFWIKNVLANQRSNGDFGPNVVKNGVRDLWTNMPMLWCLQSYYDYSHDAEVLTFFDRYFRWQLSLPDDKFLEDYWEKSRGGDNLLSVYWLYNRTKQPYLLELASKIDRNTSNWRQKNNLPNWHNVNIVECFREPATYFLQSHNAQDLQATYDNFHYIRNLYGQVPGGLFGADENARKGYDDPRQAVETCGMVEQMTSDQYLVTTTGDPFWAENCEDIAFNTFPAAFTEDYKALRYLTAPNMVLNDSANHHPGIDNSGPFLMMNPFSSRCCQHNHSAGWIYFIENSWMATPDNGLAAVLYGPNSVNAKVANGVDISVETSTHYPFDDQLQYTLHTKNKVTFPLYFRIPQWCVAPIIKINGKVVSNNTSKTGFIQIKGEWQNNDKITVEFPMRTKIRQWTKNKNSISIDYGPLTYSLLIQENYIKGNSAKSAVWDSKWLPTADPTKWPSYEIHPNSDWNYGLLLDSNNLEKNFQIVKHKWPKDNNPFSNKTTPITIKTKGQKIMQWTIDQYGLCGVLPNSPIMSNQPTEQITLVPMGGARLRIASFPLLKQ